MWQKNCSGNDWDEDAAPICDGGLGLPKGGPIRYASEPGVVGEGGLSWIGQAPVVGKEIGGTGCERRWGGKAVLVATGYTHTVIVSDDECVYACGLNEHGQLGVGDLRDRHLPTELPFFRSVASAGGGVAQVPPALNPCLTEYSDTGDLTETCTTREPTGSLRRGPHCCFAAQRLALRLWQESKWPAWFAQSWHRRRNRFPVAYDADADPWRGWAR